MIKKRGYKGGQGGKGRIELLECIREVFKQRWLKWRRKADTSEWEEGIWKNGWLKRHGIVAGGLYLEEEHGWSRRLPSKGILVGIRGVGRIGRYNRVRRCKKQGGSWPRRRNERRRIQVKRRIIINLEERLKEIEEERVKIERGVIDEKKEPARVAENKRMVELLKTLVEYIVQGDREVRVSYYEGQRYVVERKRWVENHSEESEQVDIRIKYLIKWEHIGNLSDWKPWKNRFIKKEPYAYRTNKERISRGNKSNDSK